MKSNNSMKPISIYKTCSFRFWSSKTANSWVLAKW